MCCLIKAVFVKFKMPSNIQSNLTGKPRIGITMGDAAGIGAEIVLKAVAEANVKTACVPVVIGDAEHLKRTAQTFNLACDYKTVRRVEELNEAIAESTSVDKPLIYNLDNIAGEIAYAVESPEAGRAAAQYIETAVALCMNGALDAMATAPINKRSLQMGGYDFPGHTEFLAHLSNAREYAMAFVAGNLRIVLLSTHVSLADALKLIRRERIARTIKFTHRELERFGITNPRIAVAALNPHGGEGGLFGMEEANEIIPAIEETIRDAEMRDMKINVTGAISADTVFLRAARGEFDCVVALYHDQAMIPVKCLSFGEAVNVTLGLPFVRTSVDHGTAFDIAGRGIAEHSSMVAAILLAADFAKRKTLATAA